MKTFDTWMNEAYSSAERKQHTATRYGDNFKLPPLVPGEKVGPPNTATREFVRTPDPNRNPAETMPKGASKNAKSVNDNPLTRAQQAIKKRQDKHQIKRDVTSSVNTFTRGQSKYQFGNETGRSRSRVYPSQPQGTRYGGRHVPGVI